MLAPPAQSDTLGNYCRVTGHTGRGLFRPAAPASTWSRRYRPGRGLHDGPRQRVALTGNVVEDFRSVLASGARPSAQGAWVKAAAGRALSTCSRALST